jgi:hypothetical protein
MTFQNQPILQFLLLTGLGLFALGLGLALVSNYKALRTRCADASTGRTIGPRYQELVIWTKGQLKFWSDKGKISKVALARHGPVPDGPDGA